MLTSVDRVKALFGPSMDGGRLVELDGCVRAASDWVTNSTGLFIEKTSYTEVFDGNAALGTERIILELDPRRRPILHAGGDLVVVTENGVTLTIAQGYSTTADVILEGAGLFERRCRLVRRTLPWARGIQNISVAYSAGYSTSGGTLDNLPPRVVQLASEAAWLMWQSQSWVGKGSTAVAGQSVVWEKNLSPLSRETLSELRRLANA